MIDESTIYWMTRFDDIRMALEVGSVVGLIAGVILLLASAFCLVLAPHTEGGKPTAEEQKALRAMAWRFFKVGTLPLAVSIAFSIAYVLIPSTKQYAAIKAIPMVLNSDEEAEAR